MKPTPFDNSEPQSDGFNFTPQFGNGRVQMRISAEDCATLPWRGIGYRGTVTDLDTGKQYRVYGRPCGLGCYCDAEIKEFEA